MTIPLVLYTIFVYTFSVKNITLSADEHLIERARSLAQAQHKTLNTLFREWLHQLTSQHGETQSYEALMERLSHVRSGRHFSRDEMNER
jgi:hypothetical protein